jgi:hypothetical protein
MRKLKHLVRGLAGLGLAVIASCGLTMTVCGAVYDVGPGQSLTNLASVPWTTLNPGDTVNIHYQPGGYREIILLSSSGVSNAPITINGVADTSTGALPVLDGRNAVTATNTPWRDNSLNTAGVIVVSPAARQPRGSIPSWIVIQNLRVQNASSNVPLTEASGAPALFDGGAAAIYVEFGQHIIIRGCQLSKSCNGLFCGALDGDPNETSADILVEHCWVHDNGFAGNYNAHNLATQSKGVVFQFNRIGPLQPGADGNNIKDQSSGTIIRYNQVIQATDGASIWLVQPQGGLGVIDTDPAYHTNFIYGNVFLNTTNSSGLTMFVYDSLGIQGQPRNGTLYFYNNTVVNYADQSRRYYTDIFQLPTHDEVTAWNVHDTLDCRNNIFASIPATPGGTPSEIGLLGSDDSSVNFGVNWISPSTDPLSLPYGSTNFFGAMTGANLLIAGDKNGLNNPGFVNPALTNFYLLDSSPAIDAAGPQSPFVLASPNNVVEEYVSIANGQLRSVNGMGLDLGAFEGSSTNYSGHLHSVTVNGGFGGGNFPSNATVPVAAQPAPFGQAFAGWTGYPVADSSSIGTTFTMPATNVALTATFTNLPVPVDFTLTVVNGSGGGLYLPGAVQSITADAPPSGETFTGWSGFPVADSNAATTTLTMPASDVTVVANYQVSSTFNLTVINGSGGGVYAPGAVVTITATNPPAGDYFSGWSGYNVADASAITTTLTMPAADLTVAARFQSTNAVSTTIPFPVSSHPRLWITTNDLPRLRSWAIPGNPVYMAVRNFLTNSMVNYDTQYFPGGIQNPNYPDFGDSQGYTGLITEEDAIVFALFSLVDPDPAQRAVYAERAANLLRVAVTQAALGPLANAPFRDPGFATYNRANETLKLLPLAVDWVYDAVGTNGQPVFSAADKLIIRDAFMVWCEACRHAETAGGDSPPPDVVNDPSVLCPDNAAYRMAANNYYIGHARMMTLMSLAIDPADDPAIDPSQPVSAETNSLRSYIGIANGAWLFQEYAMFGEGPEVAADFGLPGDGANFGLSSGGMPPEGMLYGASMGSVINQLLALQTAGFGDTNLAGPQVKLINAPVWDRFCDAWLAALTPHPDPIETYLPSAYQMFGYGDTLRLYAAPDFSAVYSSLAMLDYQTGNTNRLAKTAWLAMEAPEGGYENLVNRAGTSWGANEAYEEGLLYFLTLDPATLAPPADPRPAQPAMFYDQPQGMVVAQTDWTTNRSVLFWRCSWISINHQNGDAGMFQFTRNGEFLTAELTGYDANDYGQASWLHNTIALKNTCPAGTPGNLGWFEEGLWETGSQWQLGEGAADPFAIASGGGPYVYTYGDMTQLYNRPSFYSPENACLDIQQATRSLLWVKPDHIIVYDRAQSQSEGLFKRFNLCASTEPSVSPRPGGGTIFTETMPSGQQLFINSILPANGAVGVYSLSNLITTVAEGQPSNYRLVVEDTNNPTRIRFLHVLQGADAGVAADPTTYVQSESGAPFEGVNVRGITVMFPVDTVSNNFSSLVYTAPAGTTNHYVTGLAPNTNYAVTIQITAGQPRVTVVPGGKLSTDSAGVLAFDNSGAGPAPAAPRWTLIAPGSSGWQLNGMGTPLQSYSVQASTDLGSTNWTTLGSATADGAGTIQFLDSTSPQAAGKFYRLAQ